jgi:hypothetical protein
LAKINLCFKVRGGLVIKDNFVGARLRRRIKDYSEFSMLLTYSLGGCSAMRGEKNDPKFEREDVTIFLFFIHGLCGHLGMLVKSMLITLAKRQVFILTFFFKIKVGWTALVDDALDVIAVFFCNVGGD